MYSKILVPIDGSENSLRALKHGLFLGSKVGAKLVVLYVLDTPPLPFVQSEKVIDSVNESFEKESEKVFAKVDSEAQNYDITYETVLLEGHHISSLINEYADQNDIDAIIIGSRGHGKVKTAILGSVSQNVLHHTKKPVLIIK
jgi:nucleotide-binding universal stress UspA family protein